MVGALVSLFLLLAPQSISAAEINFNLKPSGSGDNKQTVVEVRVNPQSKRLNLIEGKIKFAGSMTDKMSVQVENGNSVLNIWPVPPIYNEKDKSINFIGGKPDGFQSEGLLFIMKINSSGAGDLNISYTDGSVYLNDGKGTKVSVYSKPVQISGSQDVSFKSGASDSITDQGENIQPGTQQINSEDSGIDQVGVEQSNQTESSELNVSDVEKNDKNLFPNQNKYAILVIVGIALFFLIIYGYRKTKI